MDYAAVTLLAISMAFTPGPNNLLILRSGMAFGLTASLPHAVGISVGFPFLFIALGLGADVVFAKAPWLMSVIKWLGVAYMSYIAYIMVAGSVAMYRRGHTTDDNADAPDSGHARNRPFRFWQAVLFQWVNIKAWLACLSIIALYTQGANIAEVALLALIFFVVTLCAVMLWLVGGLPLRALLAKPKARAAFDIAMAVCLMLGILPALV